MNAAPDLIVFDRLSWEAWQALYRPRIRCIVEWEKLGPCPTSIQTLCLPYSILVPRHKAGPYWMAQKPEAICISSGWRLAFLRAPAVKINEKEFFLLDGYHRLSSIRPAFLILDLISPSQKKLKYFADLGFFSKERTSK